MDSCFNLVSQHVSDEDWETFTRKLVFGFKGFPEDWRLPADLREKLILKLQWEYFNPDIVEGIATKRSRSWAFMTSFLSETFRRKFTFLRVRYQRDKQDKWDRDFANFETLLRLSSMSEQLQLDWLANFDSRVRYGEVRRAKVIKSKGLGLSSQLLGVSVLMDWPQIKAQYRFMLKKHHPDLGGDPVQARAMIEEYQRLAKAAGNKE